MRAARLGLCDMTRHSDNLDTDSTVMDPSWGHCVRCRKACLRSGPCIAPLIYQEYHIASTPLLQCPDASLLREQLADVPGPPRAFSLNIHHFEAPRQRPCHTRGTSPLVRSRQSLRRRSWAPPLQGRRSGPPSVRRRPPWAPRALPTSHGIAPC